MSTYNQTKILSLWCQKLRKEPVLQQIELRTEQGFNWLGHLQQTAIEVESGTKWWQKGAVYVAYKPGWSSSIMPDPATLKACGCTEANVITVTKICPCDKTQASARTLELVFKAIAVNSTYTTEKQIRTIELIILSQ